MIFILIIALVLCVTLCYWWVKAVNAFFRLFLPKENPYIKIHQAKIKNDKTYSEYLKWLDKNGGDIPIDKELTKEEISFQKK
ncbi:hypothetical protein, partial [Leeuwenhoekiella nanhaiensis]